MLRKRRLALWKRRLTTWPPSECAPAACSPHLLLPHRLSAPPRLTSTDRVLRARSPPCSTRTWRTQRAMVSSDTSPPARAHRLSAPCTREARGRHSSDAPWPPAGSRQPLLARPARAPLGEIGNFVAGAFGARAAKPAAAGDCRCAADRASDSLGRAGGRARVAGFRQLNGSLLPPRACGPSVPRSHPRARPPAANEPRRATRRER